MRNRLLVSVALTAACVAAAGAPTVLAASGTLADAQDRVDRAELNQRIIALTHSLADERDDRVVQAAAGTEEAGLSDAQRARLERQIAAVRGSDALPSSLRERLARLAEPGRQKRGEKAALATYDAYSETIRGLQAVARTGTGDSAGAAALGHLDRAVAHASGTRGMLQGALLAPGSQPDLMAGAELARVRDEGARADFEETAARGPRETFEKTVTGGDVNTADRFLRRLTERSTPGQADWSDVDAEPVAAALTARVSLMRGVHSSLAAAEVRRLEGLRDDEVTSAELQAALVGGALLLALGTGVWSARSVARPLAVVRRGARRLAADPAGAEPVRFTGRNDEYADVVAALNELRDTALALRGRTGADAAPVRAEGAAPADGAQGAATTVAAVAAARAAVEATAPDRAAGDLADEPREPAPTVPTGTPEPAVATVDTDRLRARHAALARESAAAEQASPDSPVALLGQRTLVLIERLLGVVESLEADETDPARLGTLFTLDHLATRTRRHSEGLLTLAGAVRPVPHHDGPVPLLDVLRAAVSETEQYERVRLEPLPPQAFVTEQAADDVSHLVAELLDNATTFSAPGSQAQLTAWLLQDGQVMVSVRDNGTGMTGERLAELNELLAAPDPYAVVPPGGTGGGTGLGLHVAARLAARHALRVELRLRTRGGIAATVVLPLEVLAGTDAGVPAGSVGSGADVPDFPVVPDFPDFPEAAFPDAPFPDAPFPDPAAATPAAGTPPAPEVPDADGPFGRTDASAAADPGDTQGGLPVRQRRTGSVPHPPALERNVAPPIPVADAVPADRDVPRHDTAEDAVREEPGRPGGSGRGTPVVPPQAEPYPEPAADQPTTETGLPLRTPKAQGRPPAGPPPARTGGADPDELRRRLGGLQRGAQKGRRDAAAEIAAERGANEEEARP
ncbi:nitrate- and nitrite sensing domain-containing protein [Streptomyces sp. NPDC054784]